MEKKDFFAPSTKGLGATRRAAVLLLVMMLTMTAQTAWAQFDLSGNVIVNIEGSGTVTLTHGGGTVNPVESGTSYSVSGKQYTLNFLPSSGYIVKQVTLNDIFGTRDITNDLNDATGIGVLNGKSYSISLFTNVTQEYTVTFEQDNSSGGGGVDPSNPGGDDPSNPGGDNPFNPGGVDPSNPGGDNPFNPGGVDPSNPGGDDPFNPGGDDPSNPGGDDPLPANTYRVRFDGNQANCVGLVSGSMDDQMFTVGVAQALAANEFTNDLQGLFPYCGWNTKADGSGTAYADGEVVTDIAAEGQTITLYAQWGEFEVSSPYAYVYFNANGGTGTMTKQQFHKGIYENLTPCTFTRTHYNFTGWNTQADGSGDSYDDQQEIMLEKDITLYAQWEKEADLAVNGNTYTINTAAGWDEFCNLLEGNDKGFFTDKTVKLAYDISVTRMAGDSGHPFTGTFDGNQKTLTVSYGSADSRITEQYAAPFRYVEGCTIQNLHVAGTIQTSNKYAAGIIAQQYGSVTIQNCQSSVVIKSSIGGDGTHGGLVAVNNNSASLTIDGCVFDGKLLSTGTTATTATTNCGGFVGWKNKNGTVTVTNSRYAPAALGNDETECTSGSATFVRNGSAGDNCYYTRTLGTAQGTWDGEPDFVKRGDGAGTSANPYKITNANDLKDLAVYVNGTGTYSHGFTVDVAHDCSGVYFQQTNPITLSGNWTPIGTSSKPFKGKYDGDNKTISGLTVSGSYQYAGLFGYTKGTSNYNVCSLKNIIVKDCNIDVSGTTESYAGGIVGYASDDTQIRNCRVSGTVTATTGAGGIAGQLWTTPSGHISMMSQCFADVTVAANNKGKLIGYVSTAVSETALNSKTSYYHADGSCTAFGNNVDITYSVPLYTVTASSSVTVAETNATLTHGGKHFFASGATATLTIDDASKAFSTFSVSGATYSLAADRKNATVTLASSDATVSATLITITGSCGTNATWTMSDADGNGTFETLTINGTGAITSSPWATDFAATIERVNIGSADLTISGNPFSTLGEGALIVVPTTAYAVSYSSAAYASKLRVALGSYLFTATNEGGTAAYEIANETDLRNLSAAVNQNHQGCNGLTFCQTAPITLNGTFTPIGYFNDSSDKQDFYGTYDGGGYTISGLSVSSTQVYTGLFGVVRNGGMVKNVRLISPSVTCNFYESRVGALIGLADQCTIENCSVVSPIVSATASSQYNKVGALVGNLSAANVQNCFVVSPTVSAAGSTKVGAICGYAYSASTNSYCTLTNVYYYNSSLEAIGQHDNSQISKVTNVARARKVTAGDGVTVSPAASDPANGFVYNNESYYREGLELTLGNTLGEAPEYYALNYATTAGTINGSTLTVGNADATVSAAIRSDGQPHSITYMKADGTTDQADAIALDGYETAIEDYSTYNVHLAAGTYYVGHDISYVNKIVLDGDITLILGNGKTMTLASDVTGIHGGAIDLTIYGQSLDPATAGTLRYDGTSSKGIYVGDYTQHSGNVSLICSSYNGVYALEASTVTLNGGKLTITANSTNAKAIKASMTVTITGGQLDATATGTNAVGILTSSPSYGDITLGWTNADDYIHVSSYKVNQSGTVKIADGQSLYNGSEVLSGTITDMSKLNGKTLRPYKTITLADAADNSSTIREWNGSVADVTLQGRTLYKDGDWNTLCLPFDVSTTSGPLAGDNVVAMTLNTSESNLTGSTLTLNFEATTTIPAGTPFIIKWATKENPATNLVSPVFTGVTIDNTMHNADFAGGTFKGTYSPIVWNTENKSILFVGENNTLYYPKSGAFVNACRAYFELSDDSQAREFVMNFDGENEVTSLPQPLQKEGSQADAWYTLDGRKLNGKPTTKGLYIHNGKKVIIK